MTTALIWDMDGTLVDTAALHFAAWQELMGELAIPFSAEHFRVTFGWRNPEIFEYLAPGRWSPAQMWVLGERKEQAYRQAAQRQGVSLLPGVRPLLEAAAKEGLRQAIGSSAPRANLDLILELTASRSYFQALVSGEDTQRGKPDPEVFLLAAARLGAQPAECVVIEGAVAGVQAAKAAGMRCVAISGPGQHSPERLAAAGANFVVHSLAELTLAELLRKC
jgi:beta-phosphoglucomutase